MPKKTVKEYAAQLEELQDRNDAIEKIAMRLVELARKQEKLLKELPAQASTPPTP